MLVVELLSLLSHPSPATRQKVVTIKRRQGGTTPPPITVIKLKIKNDLNRPIVHSIQTVWWKEMDNFKLASQVVAMVRKLHERYKMNIILQQWVKIVNIISHKCKFCPRHETLTRVIWQIEEQGTRHGLKKALWVSTLYLLLHHTSAEFVWPIAHRITYNLRRVSFKRQPGQHNHLNNQLTYRYLNEWREK